MNDGCYIGRLGNDPELKKTAAGVVLCPFSLAVKRPHSKDVVDWINFTAWRQNAEFLCKYGHKGDRVAVTGHLVVDKFTDKDGNNRVSYNIVCDSLELLADGKRSPATISSPDTAEQVAGGNFDEIGELVDDGELPF